MGGASLTQSPPSHMRPRCVTPGPTFWTSAANRRARAPIRFRPEDEAARVTPVIAALSGAGIAPLSIDTRKATVARAALAAGAAMVNDVSALCMIRRWPRWWPRGVPVCLMHAQGDPKTMQDAPRYDDVTLDVFDWLAAPDAMPRPRASRAAAS